MTGTDDSRGILLIATGARFNAAAYQAAASIRRHMPDVAIALFTDDPAAAPKALFSHAIQIENPHYRSKVDCLPKTPFDRTLYIDSDIRLLTPIDELFEVLDRFDIAAVHAHARNRAATQVQWRQPIPEAFPQLNCGLILYRRSEPVMALLEAWREAFHTAGFKKDQVTFRELVWLSPLRLYVLPPEYNIRYKKYLNVWGRNEARPRLLHLREFQEAGRPWWKNFKDRCVDLLDELGLGLSLVFGAVGRFLTRRGRHS